MAASEFEYIIAGGVRMDEHRQARVVDHQPRDQTSTGWKGTPLDTWLGGGDPPARRGESPCRRRWLMMLCCLHDGFNGTVGLSLSQVFLESISEDGQLTIGLEATEGFLGLQQAGGGPSERHLGVSPAFDGCGVNVPSAFSRCWSSCGATIKLARNALRSSRSALSASSWSQDGAPSRSGERS